MKFSHLAAVGLLTTAVVGVALVRPAKGTSAERHAVSVVDGKAAFAPCSVAFVAAPAQTVPGTRMFYAGQKDPAKRAALIAYLKTLH